MYVVREPLRASAPERTGLAMMSELSATLDEAAGDPVRIGRALREARLARGETLAGAAAWLRIREDYLAALERGAFDAMPGRPYLVGFLRSYGDHLGLGGDRLVAGLRPTLAPVVVPRPSARAHLGGLAVIAACLLVAGAAWALREFGPRVPDAPPVQLAAAPGPDPVDVASAAAAEPAATVVLATEDREERQLAALAAAGSRLSLVARADAWVQLRSGDRSFVRSGLLQPGQRLDLPPRRDLLLSASDGAALEFEVDGARLGLAGTAGQPLRDLPLDTALGAASRPTAR